MISGGGSYTTWTLLATPPAAVASSAGVVVPPATQFSFLGYGLTTPFQRGTANDFASAAGAPLVKSRMSQIAGTTASSSRRPGELPWRGEFGMRLQALRLKSKTQMLEKRALHRVAQGLALWEPCVRVATTKLIPQPGQRALTIKVLYDILTTNPVGNQVAFPGQSLDVPLDPSAQ